MLNVVRVFFILDGLNMQSILLIHQFIPTYIALEGNDCHFHWQGSENNFSIILEGQTIPTDFLMELLKKTSHGSPNTKLVNLVIFLSIDFATLPIRFLKS